MSIVKISSGAIRIGSSTGGGWRARTKAGVVNRLVVVVNIRRFMFDDCKCRLLDIEQVKILHETSGVGAVN